MDGKTGMVFVKEIKSDTHVILDISLTDLKFLRARAEENGTSQSLSVKVRRLFPQILCCEVSKL